MAGVLYAVRRACHVMAHFIAEISPYDDATNSRWLRASWTGRGSGDKPPSV